MGKRKVQERSSQISLSLCARLCPLPAASGPPAFALRHRRRHRGGDVRAAAWPAVWPRPAELLSKQRPGAGPDRSQGDRPEEIWGVIEEREMGGGTASLCLLSGYIIF